MFLLMDKQATERHIRLSELPSMPWQIYMTTYKGQRWGMWFIWSKLVSSHLKMTIELDGKTCSFVEASRQQPAWHSPAPFRCQVSHPHSCSLQFKTVTREAISPTRYWFRALCNLIVREKLICAWIFSWKWGTNSEACCSIWTGG